MGSRFSYEGSSWWIPGTGNWVVILLLLSLALEYFLQQFCPCHYKLSVPTSGCTVIGWLSACHVSSNHDEHWNPNCFIRKVDIPWNNYIEYCNTHALRLHDSASLTGLTSASPLHCVQLCLPIRKSCAVSAQAPQLILRWRTMYSRNISRRVMYDPAWNTLSHVSDVQRTVRTSLGEWHTILLGTLSSHSLGHVSDVRHTVGTLTQFRNTR